MMERSKPFIILFHGKLLRMHVIVIQEKNISFHYMYVLEHQLSKLI